MERLPPKKKTDKEILQIREFNDLKKPYISSHNLSMYIYIN